MKVWYRWLYVWLIVALLLALPGSVGSSVASSSAQLITAQQKAVSLLAKMTPEERVGQLFLVTFQGGTISDTAPIYNLIANYHIGGVVLTRANDNFTSVDNLPGEVFSLDRQLQESAWKASQHVADSTGGESTLPTQYIPLFIGISQEGNDYPNDQIMNGLTPLPDLMSIGATWNPELASRVGQVMGKELSAMGINLYLGPSLDVLDSPQPENSEDLGVRTFGGSPYWVGKMGQAYIAGLHQGSRDQVVVIAKNFPGVGNSDRSPDDEIATVRRSLDQLKQIELAPFFAVMGNASDPAMQTDGVLVSHIRYQGFQGVIRPTTRPISSDSGAMDQILKLPEISQWRDRGGVLVSDNLGSNAIRKFYDPTGNSFDARTVAREAFFAGNDLLYVDNFVATGDKDASTTLARTLAYFAQKYREDAVFAQRVDASVERILTLKYQLYPEFIITRVSAPEAGLADIGLPESQAVTFDAARRSVTLISPDGSDLQNVLPRGPEPRDRVVFLTDVQIAKQCSTCAQQPVLAVDALQSTVMRLYGPRAGGQVLQGLMSSYSFMDLWKYLNGYPANSSSSTTTIAEPNPLEQDLKTAGWIVVSMLKPNPNQQETQAFRRLLSERPDLLRDKKIIVFAFSAPYYLDATDISKLTAYYGLYSKTAPFVEVAARIFFQDLPANGYLPVSVPGTGYVLSHAVSPDPTQVIPLLIDNPASTSLTKSTQEPTPAPFFRVGDVIPLRTGVIYDYNKNPVPDGTPVHFVFDVRSETKGSTQQTIDTETVDGVARAMYTIDRPGLLDIQARMDLNVHSNLMRLDITSGISAGVTVVAATPQPTQTIVPTPTVTITATATQKATATPIPVPASVDFTDWFFVFLIVLGSAAGVSWFGMRQALTRWGLRWALCGAIGGMLFYNYLALGLPGSEGFLRGVGTPGVALVALVGVLFGWGVGILWRQLTMPIGKSTGGRRTITGPKSQSD